MPDAKLIDLPALAVPSADDLLYIVDDPAGTPTSKKITLAALTASLAGAGGKIAQVVTVQSTSTSTGTTQIPLDPTIPQQSEGDQYLTATIVPIKATNTLRVQVTIFGVTSVAARWITVALFRDTALNAIAAQAGFVETAGATSGPIVIDVTVPATSVASTSFRVRIGLSGSGTFTFNSTSLGGTLTSGITVTEIGSGPSGGDVAGPASSLLNAVPRYSDTTGKLLKDSLVTVTDLGGVCDFGRAVPLGVWQNIPFAAGNFTGESPMTWTVEAADQVNFSYTLIGKTAVIGIGLAATTIGGTAAGNLYCALPFTTTLTIQAIGRFNVAGTWLPLLLYTLAGSNFVGLQPLGAGTFVTGANIGYFQGSILTQL